jgi:hypothetical protein
MEYPTNCTDRTRASATGMRDTSRKAKIETACPAQSFCWDKMLTRFSKKIRRVPGKIKLILLGFPIIKSIDQLRYKRRLAAFVEATPHISASAADVVTSVNREGAFLTAIENLPCCHNSSLLTSVDRLLPELQKDNCGKENSVRISHEHIIKFPDIYLWGLDEKLLDIAENCLGLPAFYHRVEVRRDLVNQGNPTPASQWHRDPADYRIFKLIVYLNDVSAGDGPFEFIARTKTAAASRALKYHSGYVSDAVMESLVPREHWQPCTGARGSVVVGDTASVFHRIQAPVNSHRLSITFTYTSRKPVRVYDEISLPAQDIANLGRYLTERQKQCLFLD